MAPRTLTLLPGRLAICRLPAEAPLPAWARRAGASFWSITRTPRELSIVCPEEDLPPSAERAERGWRAFEVEGPIPFDETGVIAGLAAPLAAAGVPVFVISTHDTDLLLVRERDLDRARPALAGAALLREG